MLPKSFLKQQARERNNCKGCFFTHQTLFSQNSNAYRYHILEICTCVFDPCTKLSQRKHFTTTLSHRLAFTWTALVPVDRKHRCNERKKKLQVAMFSVNRAKAQPGQDGRTMARRRTSYLVGEQMGQKQKTVDACLPLRCSETLPRCLQRCVRHSCGQFVWR